MISVSVLTALGRTDAQCCLTAGLSQVPGPAACAPPTRPRSRTPEGAVPHAASPQSGFHVKHEFVDLDLRSG